MRLAAALEGDTPHSIIGNTALAQDQEEQRPTAVRDMRSFGISYNAAAAAAENDDIESFHQPRLNWPRPSRA